MPWYYKKHGEFGKKNVTQVTRKWLREVKLRKLEIDGEARLKRLERKAKAKEELQQARARHLLNKVAEKKRLAADEVRRVQAFNGAFKARKVVHMRLSRIDEWGRENVERACREEALRQAAEDRETERVRVERERETFERRCMEKAEHEMKQYLERSRTLPEQVLLRRAGFLEAKPHVSKPVSVLDELEDTGALGGRNRARADLHVIEISCVQPERDEEDDSNSEEDEDTYSAGDNQKSRQAAEEEDQAYLGTTGALPCVLTVDLEKFPAAMELRCTFAPRGKIGMRLLCNTIAPPRTKQSAFLAARAELAEAPAVLVPNLLHLNLARNNIGRQGARMLGLALARGMCPRLKTLDLRSNMIEDAGLKGILEAVHKKNGDVLSRLRTLCLRQNGIGDSGAQALTHTLLQTHLPNLCHIDLKMNRIRFRGAHALLGFLESTCKHRRFRELNLSGNFIDRTKLGRYTRITPKGATL